MNVSFQAIIQEYRGKVDELTYQTTCQQLAIKALEARQKELEDQLAQSEANLDAESKRATELQDFIDNRDTSPVQSES